MECKCGVVLQEGTKFCPSCGKRAPKPKPEPVSAPNVTIINSDQKLSFNVKEAASALGVSTSLVRELINTKKIAACRIGERRIVIRRSTLEQYLLENENKEVAI